MLKYLKKMKLNQKLTILMITTFLVVFSSCIVLFALIFLKREEKAIHDKLLGEYHRIEHFADNYTRELDLAAATVMCSTWVQQLYTSADLRTPALIRTDKSNAQRFLSCFASIYEELDCMLVLPNGEYLKNNNSYIIAPGYQISGQSWYPQLMQMEKYRMYGHNGMFIKRISDQSVTTYYVIKSIYNLKPLGFFVVNVKYDAFRMLPEQLDEGDGLLIADRSGNVVCTNLSEEKINDFLPEKKGQMTKTIDSARYYDTLMGGEWNIWIVKKRSSLFQSARNNFYMFLLLIPVILVFSFISVLFSRYLTKPIVLCTKALREIRNENYNIQIPNHYRDEIGDMIDGFNDMSSNIEHLLDMNRAMYRARLKTEFLMLQQRINPHFLCNTLEILNGMILCGEEEKALELTGMLGQLYRYDLGEKDTAYLEEEIDYLKNYLTILEFKYRDLQVSYDIDEGILAFVIPKFVCQPLVENAMKHGFKEKAGNCRLRIKAGRAEKKIMLQIEDNGAGIPEELLEELRDKIRCMQEDQTIAVNEYIGMLNTARRLFLYYGKDCSIRIFSKEGKGTRIEIFLPEQDNELLS